MGIPIAILEALAQMDDGCPKDLTIRTNGNGEWTIELHTRQRLSKPHETIDMTDYLTKRHRQCI